jgi:signal transduction histidine kinase
MDKVVETIIRILKTSDIELSMEILSEYSAEISCSAPHTLYMLSTQKAAFVGVFGKKKNAIYSGDYKFSDNKCITGKRKGLVVGFLEWDVMFRKIDEKKQEIIGAIIVEIYRRYYVGNFFNEIQRSVDFTNQDTYFRDTAKLLSDTLSMEMVAIRQINSSNNLDCRAFYRYPELYGDRIDFDGDDMPLPFREVVEDVKYCLLKGNKDGLKVKYEIVNKNDFKRYGFLFCDNQISQVKAFALFPIVIGDDFFGIVSCSTTVPFQFSSLEKTVIRTAMKLVTVAISNFIKYHEAKRMTDVIHEQLFSATELEIAQSARHELQNIEAEQVLLVDEIHESISRNTKDKRILEALSSLKDSVLKLDASITKLRYSGVFATPKIMKTSVAKVWEEATDLMKERLNMMGIKIRYVGPKLEGDYYPDWLREALLNLLFNSIDAFRDRPRQNRNITLVAQKESEASQYYVFDYSDNAGGIAFGKLNIPEPIKDANPGMSPEELIFQPKVTSKKGSKGSGWGLYLVRQAIRIHKGSISLRDNTKIGCTFRIQILKNLKEK